MEFIGLQNLREFICPQGQLDKELRRNQKEQLWLSPFLRSASLATVFEGPGAARGLVALAGSCPAGNSASSQKISFSLEKRIPPCPICLPRTLRSGLTCLTCSTLGSSSGVQESTSQKYWGRVVGRQMQILHKEIRVQLLEKMRGNQELHQELSVSWAVVWSIVSSSFSDSVMSYLRRSTSSAFHPENLCNMLVDIPAPR